MLNEVKAIEITLRQLVPTSRSGREKRDSRFISVEAIGDLSEEQKSELVNSLIPTLMRRCLFEQQLIEGLMKTNSCIDGDNSLQEQLMFTSKHTDVKNFGWLKNLLKNPLVKRKLQNRKQIRVTFEEIRLPQTARMQMIPFFLDLMFC